MTVAPPRADEALAPVRRRARLRWWKEVAYILAFYGVYTVVRNTQGSATVSLSHARRNALSLIHVERILGIFHEQAIQKPFLTIGNFFVEFWNLFYGTFHFVVTAAALIYLFRKFPERYPRWRNTLAWTTALALVGFALYPLMPPRLLDSTTEFGPPRSGWPADEASRPGVSSSLWWPSGNGRCRKRPRSTRSTATSPI